MASDMKPTQRQAQRGNEPKRRRHDDGRVLFFNTALHGGRRPSWSLGRRHVSRRATVLVAGIVLQLGIVVVVEATPIPTALPTDTTFVAPSSSPFTGTVPTELGALTEMTSIYLGENILNGTIPTELGKLTKLRRNRCRERVRIEAEVRLIS